MNIFVSYSVCYEDLIDEALNDESDLGEAMKPFIEKGVMSKLYCFLAAVSGINLFIC